MIYTISTLNFNCFNKIDMSTGQINVHHTSTHPPVRVEKRTVRTRVFATAVGVITNDRVANCRTVHTDLMTSAGDELQKNFGRGIRHEHAALQYHEPGVRVPRFCATRLVHGTHFPISISFSSTVPCRTNCYIIVMYYIIGIGYRD